MSLNEILYQIADELRGVASTGLYFCENGYDKERYDQVLHLSARLVAALETRSEVDVYQKYAENFTHVSPLVAVEGAVFRDEKILLIRRRDDGLWALPGGLCEVGETLSQAVVRELWEEAGVHGQVVRLLGMYDSRFRRTRSKMHLIGALFLLNTSDDPRLHAEHAGPVSPMGETIDVGFFAEDQLPEFHPGHDIAVPLAFKLYRGEIPTPYFD